MSSNDDFTFEIDPSILPQLDSQGSNYPVWRAVWTMVFQYAKVWDVVSDGKAPAVTAATPAPAALSAQIAQYEKDDMKAMLMLISAVHSDLVSLVATASSAHQAWATLKARFRRDTDRDTAPSIIRQFRQLTSLRYDMNDNLVQHLDTFHQTWTALERRCKASSHEVAKNLDAVLSSESIKCSFFLATLPGDMDTVVDNLSTQNIIKFAEIKSKMLDIANQRAQLTEDKAFYTKSAGKATRRQPTPDSSSLECTWCRKHNLSFVGHVYTDCHKLAEHQKQKRQTASQRRWNRPLDAADA
jgi:hypothetical protein